MPAPKDPIMLHGHWTKDQIEEKQKSKASVTPRIKLKVPRRIRDSVNLYTIWKRTLKLYDGTELLNALDTDLLARYCEETYALEEMIKLRGNRRNVSALLDQSVDKLQEIISDGSVKDEIGEENFGEILKIVEEGMTSWGLETTLKLETRIEAKTKMLNQMALALYMTPRARAGAVPNQPDKEAKEDDPNAEMFD